MEKIPVEIRDKIRNLRMEFKDQPQPELLIPIPNNTPYIPYTVRTTYPEFTSLCPLTFYQPDFGTITIEYGPEEWVVELKSLKFYLVSFRNVEIFHEQVPVTILQDLKRVISPYWIKVTGEFTVRGGIQTTVSSEVRRNTGLEWVKEGRRTNRG